MNRDDFLDELLARIRSHLEGADSVVEYVNSSSLGKTCDLSIPLEGMGTEMVMSDIDAYLRHCVRTDHPGFMNPLWGGLNLAAFAGEIIASMTNTSMYTFELAPMATLIEQALIKRMCEMIGFGEGNGTLTTGGSNGNMLGIMCARQQADPIGQRQGYDGRKYVLFVSSESHYSVLMAANVLGIGYDNVVKVACDDDGCMRVDRLEEEIHRSRSEGKLPFCVIATAGTTVRGAFDPIRDVSEICLREGLWFHVDAAWGGTCLFSAKHRTLMDGIDLADSVCWDAHKMMGVPLICSAFIVKRPEILRRTCSHGDAAHYLFHESGDGVDLGRMSLQCGRRNDALKLFFAWRERGDAGWARMVEDYMVLAAHLETLVSNHPSLEMMSSRQWTNVCFRYRAEGIDHDEVNIELRDRMMRKGNFMISRSTINDEIILRPVISNPSVTLETLSRLIDEIVSTGDEITRGIPELI